MNATNAATIKANVLEVMRVASEAGRFPILYVKDANHLTMRPTAEAPAMFAYDYEGCAGELAEVLHDMKEKGEWADKGGLWSWNLKSKGGAIIGGKGAKGASKAAPVPARATDPISVYNRVKEDLDKAQQEVQRLQTAVDDARPAYEEALRKAEEAERDAVKAAANKVVNASPELLTAAILSNPELVAALKAALATA